MSLPFFVAKKDVQLPEILLVNGHRAYFNREEKRTWQTLQIILIVLYRNAIHILQKCDDDDFCHLKTNCCKGIFRWHKKYTHEVVINMCIVHFLKKNARNDLKMAIKLFQNKRGLSTRIQTLVDHFKWKKIKYVSTVTRCNKSLNFATSENPSIEDFHQVVCEKDGENSRKYWRNTMWRIDNFTPFL